MKLGKIFAVLLAMFFVVVVSELAFASSTYQRVFNTKYGTKGTRLDNCKVCHTASIPGLNPYGRAFKSKHTAGVSVARALTLIQTPDSDRDQFTNIREIRARTFPGNPRSKPAAFAARTSAASVQSTFNASQGGTQVSFSLPNGTGSGFVNFDSNQIMIGHTDADEEESVDAVADYPLAEGTHQVRVEVQDSGQVDVYVDSAPAASHTFGDASSTAQ